MMRRLEAKYEAQRHCDHRDPDGSERQCCQWFVEVKCGCQMSLGVIVLSSIWAEEDGQLMRWATLKDYINEDILQEVFEALNERNTADMVELAVNAAVAS